VIGQATLRRYLPTIFMAHKVYLDRLCRAYTDYPVLAELIPWLAGQGYRVVPALQNSIWVYGADRHVLMSLGYQRILLRLTRPDGPPLSADVDTTAEDFQDQLVVIFRDEFEMA
jgi:hypothetical protein